MQTSILEQQTIYLKSTSFSINSGCHKNPTSLCQWQIGNTWYLVKPDKTKILSGEALLSLLFHCFTMPRQT